MTIDPRIIPKTDCYGVATSLAVDMEAFVEKLKGSPWHTVTDLVRLIQETAHRLNIQIQVDMQHIPLKKGCFIFQVKNKSWEAEKKASEDFELCRLADEARKSKL